MTKMWSWGSLVAFIIFSVLFTRNASAYDTIIYASVLGLPGSNDSALYSSIASVLLREESKDKGSRAPVNFCKLEFSALTFDTSSGDAVYESLEHARLTFNSKKIAVAIGPFLEVFASTDYVITQQLHILTSPAGQNAGMMDPNRVVSVLPEPSTLSHAIAATVEKLGWQSVAFLAQDDFSPVLSLGQAGVEVWPIRLPNSISSPDDPELKRNLIELRQHEKERFILHSSKRDVVKHVLTAAQHMHLLHHSIDWFITYPDFEDCVGGENETWPGSLYGLRLLRQNNIPSNISHLIPEDMSRLELGLAVDVVGLLRHILWAESSDCSRERLINDYVVPPEAFTWQLKNRVRSTSPYEGALGHYSWDKNSNARTNFTIDVLRYSESIKKIGAIEIQNGVPNVSIQTIPSRESKQKHIFGKEKLRIATRQTDPFVIKRGDQYYGFSQDLLVKLQEKINFEFELFEPEDLIIDNVTGDYINGMVHALTTGNASMAAGALEVTADRETVISFSYTILSSQASILIKKADSTTNLFQFLGPFSTWLWLMILLFMMVAGASLYVMSRFDPTQQGVVQKFDLKESFWYSFNIVLQGSTDYSPQTTSMRAVIAFFWFCVLIIEAAYTANLAAYLTLQQMDDRIKSVADLASQTKLKYGVQKDSDIMHFFMKQQEDPYERMWAFMKLQEEQSLLTNSTEVIEKVKAGKMAYISDGVTNEFYANQYCGIESIEQNFGNKDFSLGFPRGAPYLDDVNRALLELKEEGVLDTLKDKWWSTGKNCTEEDDTRSISQKTTAELELTNMIGVFIVLAVFIGIAIIVDVSERLYRWNLDKKRQATSVELNASSETNVLENHFSKD